MAFKINSIFFNNGSNFRTEKIPLSKENSTGDVNYYTVIVGNNGIGKSRVLSNIVRLFYHIDKGLFSRSFTDFECDYAHSGSSFIIRRDEVSRPSSEFYRKLPRPSRVFAITNSLSDGFPNDTYLTSPYLGDEAKDLDFNKEYYLYFGSRNRSNNTSSLALVNKSFDVFFNTKKTKPQLEKASALFSFLSYRPLLNIVYPARHLFRTRRAGKHVRELIRDVYIKSREGDESKRTYVSASVLERAQSFLDKMSDEDFEELNVIYQKAIEAPNQGINVTVNFDGTVKQLIAQQKRYQALNMLSELGILGKRTFTFTKKNGSEFSFQKASSGEVSLISMFLGLISVIKNDSLIVIDEPELSLHPSWQFRYIELLDKMISDVSGCHVIIASHSHFLLSDMPLERSCVITLSEEGNGVIGSTEIKDETHGSSAEDILLNVFNLPSTRNYHLSILVTQGLEMVARGERSSEDFSLIINKLKEISPNLKNEDPLFKVINNLISLG